MQIRELFDTCEATFQRTNPDSAPSQRVAIVTLASSKWSAILEYRIAFPASAFYVNDDLHDVIWANAVRTRLRRRAMSVVAGIIALAASLLFAVPLSFSGFLAQVTYVAEQVEWLKRLITASPWAVSYLQGVLPQIILGCVVAIAPPLLRKLARHHGHVTLLQADLSFQTYYFLFLFLQAFLLVTLSSSLSTIASTILHQPVAIPRMLAMSIPKAGNYFMSYVTLQGFSLAIETFSIWKGFVAEKVTPYFKTMTPRRRQHNLSRSSIDLPTLYPIFTIIGVVGKLPDRNYEQFVRRRSEKLTQL